MSFLRTGDLGFIQGDHLFVTGRLKDLIVIRGRNHYPQDIEATVERSHTALRRNCGAVFSIEIGGKERLVVVHEIERNQHVDLDELIDTIRQAVAEEHGLELYGIVIARHGTVPKTTSGKIQRQHCRAMYIAGEIESVRRWTANSLSEDDNPNLDFGLATPESKTGELRSLESIERWFASQLAARLAVNAWNADFNQPLTRYGVDSLMAVELRHELETLLGVSLEMNGSFESSSIRQLANQILNHPAFPQDLGRVCSLSASAIARRPSSGPLSSNQQALYFLHRLAPDSGAYNIAIALKIHGALNQSILNRVLQELIARHAALRTTFAVEQGELTQRVHDHVDAKCEVKDVSTCSDKTINDLLREFADRPFDLELGPLFRAALFVRSQTEYSLLLNIHHIVCDGWSLMVLLRELGVLYEAFSEGQESPLPELEARYADFVEWQRRWLQSDGFTAQLAYWRRKLDAAKVAQLPADRARTGGRTFRGARRFFVIPEGLTQAVKELGRRESVTPFITLLAAFLALVQDYTTQNDLTVGTDTANRGGAETKGLVGLLVNQLVLRVDLSGDSTFVELLAGARKVTQDAFAHQDLPFPHLVSALRPGQGLHHNPLFQVMFTYRNTTIPELRFAGLICAPIEIDSHWAKFDLTVAISDEGSRFSGHLEYSIDLFEAETIEQMAGSFEAFVEQATQKPTARLSELREKVACQRQRRIMKKRDNLRESNLNKFRAVKPRPVDLLKHDLVQLDYLSGGGRLPLIVRPAAADVDLIAWASANAGKIEEHLQSHGAILFRGFNIDSAQLFERFASIICPNLFNENGEHPRENVTGNVYTPVFYPPDKKLLWHNENSFNHRWPSRIIFCCLIPPEEGGETPLVDGRKVFQRIAPEIRDLFIQKQISYHRNYGHRLGRAWQEVFGTDDRIRVENRCRDDFIEFMWVEGDRLRTWCKRPAVVKHPKTGEMVWFNQAQHWHPACLDSQTRESLASLFEEHDFPRNCYYGDGTRIADEVMREICRVYQDLEVTFTWRRGDVLLLDNLLTAHARNPYRGTRKHLVTMGAMMSYEEV
jgi:alpha-ketoglutarate-dependent taurine dioxygenase/acyl carrier protein